MELFKDFAEIQSGTFEMNANKFLIKTIFEEIEQKMKLLFQNSKLNIQISKESS